MTESVESTFVLLYIPEEVSCVIMLIIMPAKLSLPPNVEAITDSFGARTESFQKFRDAKHTTANL
jgi:hypothetical protein